MEMYQAAPQVSRIIEKGLTSVEKVTYVTDEPCPLCGGEMRAIKEPTEDTPARCGPFCYHKTIDEFGRDAWEGCGYKSLERRKFELAQRKYNSSLKSQTLNVFENGSVTSDKTVLTKTIDEFIERDETSKKAKSLAIETVDDILNGVPAHFLMTGTAGTGKTHLSVGIISNVMELSNYNKKVMFVSYSELYNQMKFAVQDRDLMKKLTQDVIADIKKADAVVIDDIGAELGRIGSNTLATDYNVTLLQQLVDARVNKATIFTTNLTSKEIKKFYGDRILSRIMANSRNSKGVMRILTFDNTKDARISM